MGKIKRFFQRTGVALAILACTIIGAVKLSPELTNPGMFTQVMTVAGGLVGAGALMIGCGIGKAVQSSKEKKLLEQYNGPQLEKPKQTVNDVLNGAGQAAHGFSNGFNSTSGNFGQRMGQAAERIGEKVGQGANKLGIEMGKLFNNGNRPNTSANPYSSTVNHGSNPYSSTDRMSAGYGGRYNGQNYNASMTGDVRDAARTGQQGGYYSGNNQQYNNGRQGSYNQQYNNGQYNNARQNNNQRRYENVQGGRPGQNGYNGYAPNNGSYNQNVQYGGGNNPNNGSYNQNVQYGGNNQNYRPNNNMNNQNVQYGNYQNNGSRPAPNTSGLEESAKSNYFENEPGSSSYRSGPLKKER